MRYVNGAPEKIYVLVDQDTGDPVVAHPNRLTTARRVATENDFIAQYELKRVWKPTKKKEGVK